MEPCGVIVVQDPRRAPGRESTPDALEHIANRPIVSHVLDALESAGAKQVVVVGSLEAAGPIKDCLRREARQDRPLRYVGKPGPVDVASALRLATPFVGNAPCIVHVASGLLGEPLAPWAGGAHADSPDVTVMIHHGAAPEDHLSAATQGMLRIAELDRERTALGMAGVCMFGPNALRHIGSAPWHSGGDVDLTIVADRIAAAGGRLEFRLVDSWRTYAGNPLDLLALNQCALDRLEDEPRGPNNNGNRIEGRVRIHQGAVVEESVIVGPTVIGPAVRVAHAYIGPYTSIGARAHVEGVEIERSIVAPGASIMHVGGRVTASVVGRDARVFRDFSLPRALRLQVGDGTVVALG